MASDVWLLPTHNPAADMTPASTAAGLITEVGIPIGTPLTAAPGRPLRSVADWLSELWTSAFAGVPAGVI